MSSRVTLLLTILVAFVAIISAVWIQRLWRHKNHYAPPFIEMRFYESNDSSKSFYTLYIAEATDVEGILAVDQGVTAKRRDGLVEVFGQGHLRYHGKTISCDPPSVSIDGQQLPPTPSQAVLKRDGQVVVGAFLRRFD